MIRVAVYGASGCGRGVMPLVRQQLPALMSHVAAKPQDGLELVFVDDNPCQTTVNGHHVLRYDDWRALPARDYLVCLAVANGRVRQQLAQKCTRDGVRFFEVRAANVVQMDDVSIGDGAIICPFVTLTSNIRIGKHFHANLYSYVEHDCVIGDFVTFAPGVQCNGNVQIENHAYIGAGAMIRQGRPGEPLVIGEGAVVGMGAVVTKSVAAGTTVAGNPARLLNR